MNRFKTMTFLALDKKMRVVANAYFASEKKRKAISHLSDSESQFDKERYQTFSDRVKWAFSSLSKEEQKFINNEYFYEEYPYWWLGQYKKREFKKNKKKAVINFLILFYEE